MGTPVYTRQFERDVRKSKRRGKDLEKLKIIAKALIDGKELDPLHRDHQLIGDYTGRRECHIEADWLLIYKIEDDRVIFERTGSHAYLLRK
ncbi:MAG TPA: type II toxin-antitoxin system YafQ family toxin [Candidatus Hydrogenedentes bacterium]|nr:type II toxin-antitoxin system YafQ family toxin [Candidatus Hydrogenedentota bacterium]HIJ74708.1 type II toxin-antitoxin system YafQ family toxin [Candidatus Hydrogenedentota bacterium]